MQMTRVVYLSFTVELGLSTRPVWHLAVSPLGVGGYYWHLVGGDRDAG